MLIYRLHNRVQIWTPAKLNLFLEVRRRRTDGFHDVETLMVPVDLYDTVNLQPCPDGDFEFRISYRLAVRSGSCHQPPELPSDDGNLVIRALTLLKQRSGICHGARVELVKRIPWAAGLGGGSSDAAAALVAANLAWELGWTTQQLAELAAGLGSDVPFFLYNSAAICTGKGEQVEPVSGLQGLHFLLICPPSGLNTGQVYANCQPAKNPANCRPLLRALQCRGDHRHLAHYFLNRLQPAAQRLSREIAEFANTFEDTDCLGHQLSGSGTGYFALCRSAAHARRLSRRFGARGTQLGKTYALRSCR